MKAPEVPFLDFKKTPAEKALFLEQVSRVIDSETFVLGSEVSSFEVEYARFNRTKFCVGVGNGLDALVISLKSLGIGPGDEVIVPANSFIATALAVSFVGASIKFAEPSATTYNLTAESAARAITEKTKAIIPVHLYGQACEMDDLESLCNTHNLSLVEDNAQAQGAMSRGRLTGSIGKINATSFYPGKNLGAFGDAGGVTTNNESLYDMAKRLRSYGSVKKYHHEVLGQNSRLDEVQAAILRLKLQQLSSQNQIRGKIAEVYRSQLSDLSELILPQLAQGSSHVYHLFVVRSARRDELQLFLHEKGVQTLVHYPIPIHLQKAYQALGYASGSYPIAESLAATSLSIPIYPTMSQLQIEQVISCIRKFHL